MLCANEASKHARLACTKPSDDAAAADGQAGFKKQLRDVLHDVEQEERASRDLRRRFEDATSKCVAAACHIPCNQTALQYYGSHHMHHMRGFLCDSCNCASMD